MIFRAPVGAAPGVDPPAESPALSPTPAQPLSSATAATATTNLERFTGSSSRADIVIREPVPGSNWEKTPRRELLRRSSPNFYVQVLRTGISAEPLGRAGPPPEGGGPSRVRRPCSTGRSHRPGR